VRSRTEEKVDSIGLLVLSSPTTLLSRGTARAGWQPPGQGARRTGPEALKFL
jgi:hypothetical protein